MIDNMKNWLYYKLRIPLLCLLPILASCDEHQDFPDTGIKVGQVLCTDGHVYTLEDMRQADKQPIAVVFHVTKDPAIEGNGYAVYLRELPATLFADSLGISQGTSCDLTAWDGNANTYAMYVTSDCGSPLADAVFDMWRFGQSAYIPSVAQMRLLYAARDVINPVIAACGGELLPVTQERDWYWTSTEVKDMDAAKAWLYSLSSGAIQETPKLQMHPARPVVTLNK